MAASLSSRFPIQEDHHCNVWYRRIYWNGRGGPHPAGGAVAAWSTGGMTPRGWRCWTQSRGSRWPRPRGGSRCSPTSLVEGARRFTGHMGLGHTRWATHGAPSDVNSHPQVSQYGRIAVVHNGIIENYAELKEFLWSQGDSLCLGDGYGGGGPAAGVLLRRRHCWTRWARCSTASRGLMPWASSAPTEPDRLIAVRKDSPLILGYWAKASTFWPLMSPPSSSTPGRCAIWRTGKWRCSPPMGPRCYDSLLQPVEKEHLPCGLGDLRGGKGRL